MAEREFADVAIIGAGPAGLAAAAEAKSAGANRVIMIERDERVGGILNQQIHDGFGIKVFKVQKIVLIINLTKKMTILFILVLPMTKIHVNHLMTVRAIMN